jgi:Fe-S oxidoreductase/nitrate reductase gamma subunit
MNAGAEMTREILGNVPPALQIGLYLFSFAACGLAVLWFSRRLLLHRRATAGATDEGRPRSMLAGIGSVLRYLTFHEQLLRDRYAGLAHLLMFHGFFILFIGTCLVFLEHDTPLHFFYGPFYLTASLIIDLGGVAFVVGLVMFLWRRTRDGEERIMGAWWVSSLPWLLLAIGVSGFLLEGTRIARDMPAFERWSVVGYGTALGLRLAGIGGEAALSWHRAIWVTHAVLCVAFFALLPWRFFGHMVYGAISWATRREGVRAALRPSLPAGRSPGAVTINDLPWRDLLQADACTTCGRCNDVCPAHAAGKALRPREVVLGLRAAMDARAAASVSSPGRTSDSGGTQFSAHISDEMLWACTTCAACDEACPVGIEIFGKIIEGRRGRIERGEVPQAAEQLFESTAAEFNPYGRPAVDRLVWAGDLRVRVAQEDEPIELLYWVGCAGSFDPDGQAVSRSLIKILNHLGINYRVLGRRECCTGDPARRMGEEGLFRELARRVIDRLERHSVVRVLTHCPHCFNTFKNEYPALGARFEVEHHSQFLARMIRERRLRLPAGRADTIVFHDPCYLARGNGETASPRQVLGALPRIHLKEMPRSGTRTFCCGAGGGAMWLDLPGTTRVENIRAQEAADVGATTVATACPFCKSMLEAGRQSLQAGCSEIDVKDLAELVVEAEGL